VDEQGDSPLHIAADKSNWEVCLALVKKHGGDAMLKNKEGKTPLDMARNHNTREALSGRQPPAESAGGGRASINIIKDDDDDDDDDEW
jgi:hypothetical protein